ncbi:hypothetical protein BT67DRAFT_233654 [Trichocladium antarcticum]|uniref:Uncharacterized protein n=1 Tax=Trichocladium antarcticum TaxID=1450529 RepID=A0AAN6UNY0_9PEZI|nr:hypothetical protein BT67DRAFT_233654 [Trichocladium antarcticum]
MQSHWLRKLRQHVRIPPAQLFICSWVRPRQLQSHCSPRGPIDQTSKIEIAPCSGGPNTSGNHKKTGMNYSLVSPPSHRLIRPAEAKVHPYPACQARLVRRPSRAPAHMLCASLSTATCTCHNPAGKQSLTCPNRCCRRLPRTCCSSPRRPSCPPSHPACSAERRRRLAC